MKHKHTGDELEAMTKDELVSLAEKEGLTVTRGDGKDGDPVKADYLAALASEGSDPSPAASSPPVRDKAKFDTTIPGGRYTNEAGETVNAKGERINNDGSPHRLKKGEE